MGFHSEYARKLMEGYSKKDYFGFLVHEITTTPFLALEERLSLIKAVGKLGVLPDEFISYRLRCLKGKDPGTPSKAVFDPPLWFFTKGWFPVGGGLGVAGDWLNCCETPPAMTAKAVVRLKEKEFSDRDEDIRSASIVELKGFANAKDRIAEEYTKGGWDRTYPEYAPIIEWYREEARRLRVMREEEIEKRRSNRAAKTA